MTDFYLCSSRNLDWGQNEVGAYECCAPKPFAGKPKSALDKQVGGEHYKSRAIQPVEFIHANALGFCEGNVVKYVSRWASKGGIADLEKAKHYLELLIEMETAASGPNECMGN